jgi:tripartite-type tricarboxylate transporter receptor subunit TctC
MTINRMIATVAALLVATAPAVAQDWPTHHLTLVVPFSTGGSSDAIARIVADGISSNLRQPVVVENVTGAGGLVGGSRVAKGRARRLSICDWKCRDFRSESMALQASTLRLRDRFRAGSAPDR